MITVDGKEFRNLQEQVGKNKSDILTIKQSLGSALPDPIPGPQGEPGASIIGPQGPRGEKGERGFTGAQGPMGAGWNSITEIDGTNYTPTVVEDSDSFVDYETDINIKCSGATHTATLKLELPKTGGGDTSECVKYEYNGAQKIKNTDNQTVAALRIQSAQNDAGLEFVNGSNLSIGTLKSGYNTGLFYQIGGGTSYKIPTVNDLATVATTGDYDDLADKPTIPTKTSDLVNNSGFITSADVPTITVFTDSDGNIKTNWSSSSSSGDATVNLGSAAKTQGNYSIAIGPQTQALTNGIAIGQSALALNNSNISIGNGSQAIGSHSIAIGYGAQVSDYCPDAVQLGEGTNGNSYTLQYLTHKIADSSGKLYYGGVDTDNIYAKSGNVVLQESSSTQIIKTTDGSHNTTPLRINNDSASEEVFLGFYNKNINRGSIGVDTSNKLIYRDNAFNDNQIAFKSDIPAQTQANWTELNPFSVAYIQNKPNLAAVATSGSYNDLSNKPTIPTKVSDLANDSGFISQTTADGRYNKIKGHLTTATLPADPDKGDIWISDDDLVVPIGGGSGTLNAFEVSDVFQDGDYVFFDNTIEDSDMLTFLQGLTYVDGTCDLVTCEDDQQQTKGLVTAINMDISEDPENPQYIYALGCYSNTNGSVAWISDGSAMGLDDGWQPLTAEGGFLLDYPDGETYMAVTSLNATVGWNGIICGTKESAIITLHTGDWLYYDGSAWLKNDNQDYSTVIGDINSVLDAINGEVI